LFLTHFAGRYFILNSLKRNTAYVTNRAYRKEIAKKKLKDNWNGTWIIFYKVCVWGIL